jgi:hypothetical protein
MSSNVEAIRLRVFKIWFVSLGVVVITFGAKVAGIRDVAPPFDALLQSFQMLLGLIVPQIGVMSAFYFNLDSQKDNLESLSRDQVAVISLLSVAYHLIFVLAIIFGVGFYGFDRQGEAGSLLQRNTAAVVAIMGLFSVFLAPVAFLFSKRQGGKRSAQKGSGGRNGAESNSL